MKLITLTTDFGHADWFVGTMKGVILGLAPRVTVVDICHEVPSGDVRGGAFALAASYRYFPRRTIHVAIVDPGVGSSRAGIAVQTANYFFIGPDNGVLSPALTREKIKAIRRLENDTYFLHPLSHTFHGRDVFAPVAAHLSRGVAIQKLGPEQNNFVRFEWPMPHQLADTIAGEVVYIDRFGNAITNIRADLLTELKLADCEVVVKNRRRFPLKPFYQTVPPHKPVCVPGSTGFLELAVNGGSAAQSLKIKIGDRVVVRSR